MRSRRSSIALRDTRRARMRGSATRAVAARICVRGSATRAVAARIYVRLTALLPLSIERRRSRFVVVAGRADDSRASAARDRDMKTKFRSPNRSVAG